MKRLFAKVIRHGNGKRNEVAITFDDGPSPDITPKVIEIFSKFQARATFFVTGLAAKDNPGIVRNLLQAGHQIGNHSWSHKSMIFKSNEFIKKELLETDDLLENLAVNQPIHFRPPFMRIMFLTSYRLAKLGKLCFKASVSPKDFKAKSSIDIYKIVMRKIKPGSIVVLHDGGRAGSATLKALPLILIELQNRGLKAVTVDELLK